MNFTKSLLAISCLCALGSTSGLARAERFIDTFSAQLPMQTLPGTQSPSPVLWAGTISGSSRAQDAAYQSSLPGVLGGHRDTTVMASQMSNLATLSSTQSGGKYALSYATGQGSSGLMLLEYGAEADLNANLIADGSKGFEIEIDGDMDNSIPNRPVELTVVAASGGGAVQAVAKVTIIKDGVYQIPFASFAGVNFADIDYLSFDFDSSAVSAIDYVLKGGIRTTRCLQANSPAVADIMLDTFIAPLPLRTLPGSGTYPILWAGFFGGTLKPSDPAPQTGLFGVISGQRYTQLATSSASNFITASMTSVSGTPALGYSTPSSTSGTLKLIYGQQSALNADLSPAKAFELEVIGDMDNGAPLRPVPLTVSVVSGGVTKSSTVTLLNDGMVYIPFSNFPNVNWSDVDQVTFAFDGSQVNAVDYTLLGGVRASACVP
jgi:hypothetical protein